MHLTVPQIHFLSKSGAQFQVGQCGAAHSSVPLGVMCRWGPCANNGPPVPEPVASVSSGLTFPFTSLIRRVQELDQKSSQVPCSSVLWVIVGRSFNCAGEGGLHRGGRSGRESRKRRRSGVRPWEPEKGERRKCTVVVGRSWQEGQC